MITFATAHMMSAFIHSIINFFTDNMRKLSFFKHLLLMMALVAFAFPVAAQDSDDDELDQRAQLLSKQYDELVDYWGGDDVIVKKNGKMGVVNADNKLFIPLQYDSIQQIGDRYYVWLDDLKGVISHSGSPIIPIKYGYLELSGFEDNYIAIQGDIECLDRTEGDFEACGVTCGVLDSIGNVVVPFSHYMLAPMETIGDDSDNEVHYLVKADYKRQLTGMIDTKGQEVLPLVYNGMLPKICYGGLIVKKESKIGVIDIHGKEIIPIIYDKVDYDESNPMLALGTTQTGSDGEDTFIYGFWDFKGNQLSDMVFSDVSSFFWGGYYVTLDDKEYYIACYSEGLTPFYSMSENGESYESSLYGYLDRHGKVAIPQQFISAASFSEGLAGVGVKDPATGEEYYGYIDTSGKMVIPTIYTDVSWFKNGLAIVQTVDDKSFIIDKQGNRIKESKAYKTDFIVDENGQTLIKETGWDDSGRFYDLTGKIVKVQIDGEYLYPRP